MANLNEHPTVKRFYQELLTTGSQPTKPQILETTWLRQICFKAGADDVGIVEIDRKEIADQKNEILSLFPNTKTLVSFVCRMNRDNIRSPMRSIANLEFHHVTDETNAVALNIVTSLERAGIRAVVGAAVGFPMEADRWGDKMWTVSHKPVAVAAGLGHMGIHRNVIHPKFGNFILLGTVLLETEVDCYSQPLDYNPCLECKLCVAACPTGAISGDGQFNFTACYTHNYREFMGGFNNWVETIAESKSANDYRKKVSGAESVSMWQSLSFGANYKAAYCMAVCPAGDDVIGPFLLKPKLYFQETVKPLQEKSEIIYVTPGSDAEDYVVKRFPKKKIKRVSNGLAGPTSIRGFLRGLSIAFQRGKSAGIDATYHFTFTGPERILATVVIRNKILQITEGHQGEANIQISADSKTWLRILRKEANLVWAVISGKIRIKGSPRLLLAFGRCFPL